MAQALSIETPDIAVTVINPGNVATVEVEDNIAAGLFAEQVPIPIADLILVIECALTVSSSSVVREINLVQRLGINTSLAG